MELVELLGPQAGEHIIDIGGGIGGPARWIASRFGCLVTSLDLTPEFCRAAEELNGATGLSDRVAAVEGSAVDLPFEQASFDRAYSENVVMNIADKRSFYGEAFRVLRSGGLFVFSNYGTGSAGEPYYPAPWAASAEMSFLSTVEGTRSDLLRAGFEIVVYRDKTAEVLPDLRGNRARLETQGLPKLGLHTLMGERIRDL
jgi:SAM-dependent methyltransferase